jgi:hypothetical protein
MGAYLPVWLGGTGTPVNLWAFRGYSRRAVRYRFRVSKEGEWHRGRRSWWRNNLAWVVIACLLISLVLWLVLQRLFR